MLLISLCDFYLETKTSHHLGTNICMPMCWTSHLESNLPTCHQLFTLLPKPHIVQTSRVTFCSPLIIYVSLPNITHMWCHGKLSLSRWFITTVSFVFFRFLMGHRLPSRGTPLLDKVEKFSQSAIHCGDHSDIFYPEFSFDMKHMGYFSPTMNSYVWLWRVSVQSLVVHRHFCGYFLQFLSSHF